MKKRIEILLLTSALAAFFLPLNSLAITKKQIKPPFTGFFVGARAGLNTNTARQVADSSVTYRVFYGTDVTMNHTNSSVYSHSAAGAISFGYGVDLGKRFNLITEASVSFQGNDLNTLDKLTTSDPFDDGFILDLNNNIKTKLNHAEFDFDLKPGILISNNTLAFAVIGGAINQMKMTSNSFSKLQDLKNGSTFSKTVGFSAKKTVVGIRAGFGLSSMLTQKLALNLSYIYTYYGKISGSAMGSFRTNGFTLPFNTASSSEVHKHTVLVGINYFFN